MPAGFVLVADFATVIAALFCTILAIALVYLLRGLASAIGSIGIGPFTLNLGNIIAGALNGAADWIVQQTKSLWVHVATILYATAYIIDHCFNAVVNAISAAFDYGDHIVTVTIPNAIDALEQDVKSYAHGLYVDVENDLKAAVGTVEGIVSSDVSTIDATIRSDVTTLGDTIVHTAAVTLQTAESYADSGIATLKAWTENGINDAENIAADATAALGSLLAKSIAQVANDAANNLSAAESTLEADIQAAAQTAASNLSAATSSLTSQIGQAEATASSEVAQLGATVQSDVGTLTNDIAGTAQALEGDIGGVSTALQAAITAGIAGVAARVAKLEQCSVGVCDDSPNNFSQLLNDALGLASVIGVGAFLTQIINNPAAAELQYAGAIQGLYQGGSSLLDDILSL